VRVEKFLNFSLLQICDSFSRNFTTKHEDVPYLILLDVESLKLIKCFRPELPAARVVEFS
jgi:hypothetical protein